MARTLNGPATFVSFIVVTAILANGSVVASGANRGTSRLRHNTSACNGSGANSFLANPNGNVAAGTGSSVVGGSVNTVCDGLSTIVGGANNIIQSGNNIAQASVIGAGSNNIINSPRSIIGAGLNNDTQGTSSGILGGIGNQVSGANGFVGGGNANSISLANAAFIGAGEGNIISAPSNGGYDYRAILGGFHNSLPLCGYCYSRNPQQTGFIGGGYQNAGTSQSESILGGGGNVASGVESIVPGGYHNLASGYISLAAGFGSYALGPESFVWSDFSPEAPHLVGNSAGQFLVRATGGVTFVTNAAGSMGATLPPGSGSWSSLSDRSEKREIMSINPAMIVDNLLSLPISTWRYKSEPTVRHLGPMAQDFRRAFLLGEDDRHISTIDAGGVSLAATQALLLSFDHNLNTPAALFKSFQELLTRNQMLLQRFDETTSIVRSKASGSTCAQAASGEFLANTLSNIAGGTASSVLGGEGNQSCDGDSSIAGGSQNIIDPQTGGSSMSFIGAGSTNTVEAVASFSGAGTANTLVNSPQSSIVSGVSNDVTGSGTSFIGGGDSNSITGASSAEIGGGASNKISGQDGSVTETNGALAAAIVGGTGNSIYATSPDGADSAFISGGSINQLTGSYAVILGGDYNKGVGDLSVVLGGDQNQALGKLSMVSGVAAYASGPGTFVWSPGTVPAVTKANMFVIGAPGGASFYSNPSATTGVTLAPGSGSWSSASDSALKAIVSPLDSFALLERIRVLPINTWSYTAENGVRHMGPMAQDFFEAFSVGEDGRHIASIDEDGITLAAVGFIHEKDELLLKQVEELEDEVSMIRDQDLRIARLLARRGHFFAKDNPTCDGTGQYSFLANDLMNVAYGGNSSVAGGTNNNVCSDMSTIAGGTQNAISLVSGSQLFSIIGAGSGNVISGVQSFIGSGIENEVLASGSSSVGGGMGNVISGSVTDFIGGGSNNSVMNAAGAIILGGESNAITGLAGSGIGAVDSAIAGGRSNLIAARSGRGAGYGFIGGGEGNTLTGFMGSIGGGEGNIVSGSSATVPGGYENLASGDVSFAAGYEAHAVTPGSFVWADYSPGATPLTSTVANQFLVRASGGVVFFSNSNSTSGALLASGSGSWSSASDRNIKTDIRKINEDDLLHRVSLLRISKWSYRSEFGVSHIGPMAQDFRSLFHVGEDSRHISMVDEDGVTLAAVKGLAKEESLVGTRMAYLRRHVAQLQVLDRELRTEAASLDFATIETIQ